MFGVAPPLGVSRRCPAHGLVLPSALVALGCVLHPALAAVLVAAVALKVDHSDLLIMVVDIVGWIDLLPFFLEVHLSEEGAYCSSFRLVLLTGIEDPSWAGFSRAVPSCAGFWGRATS